MQIKRRKKSVGNTTKKYYLPSLKLSVDLATKAWLDKTLDTTDFCKTRLLSKTHNTRARHHDVLIITSVVFSDTMLSQ